MPAALRSLLALGAAVVVLGASPSRPAADEATNAQPLSLTASDGTGLTLVALRVGAVVSDPLAFTELELTFENPEDRVLEGQFRITLPRNASVSRFAMRNEQGWQEGEVVELQAARRAYEDFLHRKQDPALLEQAAGNEFSARVFPIPARGQKQLVISFSQELTAGDEPFVVALAGLPKLGRLDLRVIDETATPPRVIERHEQAYVAKADFELQPARADARQGVRDGDLALVRVRPVQGTAPDPLGATLLLVDTSASRGLGFTETLHLVRGLAGAIGQRTAGASFGVLAFDQTAEVLYQGTAGGFDAAALSRLERRGALGASNLEVALTAAAKHLADAKARYERVVVISDGVITAGADDADALRQGLRALGAAGIQRLDAVAVGGIRDEVTLTRLTRASFARDGAVLDGKLPLAQIVDRLGRATRSGLVVRVDGASWVWPQTIDGVQAGDDVLVFARVPAAQPVRVAVVDSPNATSPAPAALRLAPTEPALLARAAARAQIASLLAQRDDLPAADAARARLAEEVVKLSTRFRVLSQFTALLVLETEEDYQRFGIDRRALADILTVGERGITLVDRRQSAPLPPKPVAAAPKPVPSNGKRMKKNGDGDHGEARSERMAEAEKSMVQDDAAQGAPPPEPGAAAAAPMASEVAAEPMAKEEAAPSRRADVSSDLAAPVASAPPPPPAASAGAPASAPPPAPARQDHRSRAAPTSRPRAPAPEPAGASDDDPRRRISPYTGPFAEVMTLVAKKDLEKARKKAAGWHQSSPGDVLALVALGEVHEKSGDVATAARAYGSLIDLFPNRADLRRFAGERLDRLKGRDAVELAIDTYRRAVAQRPDHPAGHRLLGMALLRAGDPAGAFEALAAGLARSYPDGRFAGAHEILAEDLGLAAAAWTRAEPSRVKEIAARLEKAGGTPETEPSLRFVLLWETDANDVDFHILDGRGNHAYYSQMELATGGRLYADVTTGYGPECFTIRGRPQAFPYTLQAHYYSRGPMGYGMGKLEVIHHDGRGTLRFEQRPYVVMQDNAFVDLGKVAQ